MIYPIPSSPDNADRAPENARKTNRRRRWHVSFAGVALVGVATLSLAGFLIGTQSIKQTKLSISRRSRGEDILLPISSRSDDVQLAEDMEYGYGANEHDIGSSSGDEQVSDVADETDAPPIRAKSSDEQSAEDKSDEVDGTSSRGNISTEARQFTNDNKDERASRQRRTHFPRIISFEGDKDAWINNLRGSSGEETPRKIEVSKREREEQKRLGDSDDFSYRDPLYEGDCVPMQKWQETSFPNCNLFHELDFYGKSRTAEFEYYAKGGYNHIFWLSEEDKVDDPELVIKILKYGTEYSDRNFDRVRRDGLILERLTKSPYVLDTYGFCGFDVLTPYADGGTFSGTLGSWRKGRIKLSPETRLKYAMEVAAGLAAVHDIDGEGLSSVAHGDLKGGQYLFLNGVIKLGDFNRGRFLRRNSTAPDTACTYTIGRNDAAFRSPEEYEYLPQTSAIDVYALGSILYQILTGHEVWHDTNTQKAQKYIRKGELPEIPEKILESEDPVDVALREAISMCYVFDPQKRAKAEEVRHFLATAYSKLVT